MSYWLVLMTNSLNKNKKRSPFRTKDVSPAKMLMGLQLYFFSFFNFFGFQILLILSTLKVMQYCIFWQRMFAPERKMPMCLLPSSMVVSFLPHWHVWPQLLCLAPAPQLYYFSSTWLWHNSSTWLWLLCLEWLSLGTAWLLCLALAQLLPFAGLGHGSFDWPWHGSSSQPIIIKSIISIFILFTQVNAEWR